MAEDGTAVVEIEQSADTTQSLEALLKEPSSEVEKVSDDTEATDKETKELEEEEPEPDLKLESRIKAEADKRVRTYQEKRVADTAYIRKLQEKVAELSKQSRIKTDNRDIASILSGDDELGLSEDETKIRKAKLDKLSQDHREFQEKSAQVDEAAQFISEMTAKLPAKIIKSFGLDDVNPTVRAINGYKFLDDAITVTVHNHNFLLAVEEFFPKGNEIRTQLEEIVEGMAEFEGDKAKRLYLVDSLKGLKVTLRKNPPSPSDAPGGKDWRSASPEEKIAAGIKERKIKVGGK